MASKKLNDSFYTTGLDLERRVLYIGSIQNPHEDEPGTDFAMAEAALKGLLTLDMAAPDGDAPITIITNNQGGDCYHGLAIYDAIRSCKNEVTIIAYGYVMSMGAVILQAADRRILAPNVGFMVHQGTQGAEGHAEDFQRWAKEGRRLRESIDSILLGRIREKHPRFTKRQYNKLLQFDTYLSAEEAVELGLADGIINRRHNG